MPSPRQIRRLAPQWRSLCQQLVTCCAQGQAMAAGPLDPDAIHELRLTAKRLRAGWQLLRPWQDSGLCRQRNSALSSMAASLASRRDRDVLGDTLGQLKRQTTERKLHKALLLAGDYLLGMDEADSTEPDPAAISAELQQEQWLWLAMARLQAPEDWWARGIRRLQRRAAGCAVLAAREDHHDEDFHAWRKWVKYELYACDLAGLGSEQMGERRTRLSGLGSMLGKLHDLTELQLRLPSLPEEIRQPVCTLLLQQVQQRKLQALEFRELW